MAIYKIRLNYIIGILFALTFAFLLTLRLGIFQEGEANQKGDQTLSVQARTDREVWMNILQQEQKIGYVHRQFFKTVEGFKILESVFMQINTMGMVQEIRYRTEGNFHHDPTLSSFDFNLQSSLFHFKARGTVRDKILTLFAGTPGSE